MEFNIKLELGPHYKITYNDGTQVEFFILGGPDVKVGIINEDGAVDNLSSLIQNFRSIERLS